MVLAQLMMPSDANPLGNVHGGQVMKYIDNTAAVVATKHAGNIAVTASVDRLDFLTPIKIGNLLTLKASVNYTGKSSMEIGVKVETENLVTGEIKHVASAYLTFVAIDKNAKSVSVPKIEVKTENEKRRNEDAQIRRKLKKERYKEKIQKMRQE